MGRAAICIAVLVGMTVLAGCPAIPILFKPPEELIFEDIESRLDRRREEIRTLDGIMGLELRDANTGRREVFNQRVRYIGPSKIRLDTLGFLGVIVASIAVDGESFTFYSPIDGLAVRGTLEDADLNKIAKLNISLEDISLAILGASALGGKYDGFRLKVEEKYYAIALLRGGEVSERIWVDRYKVVISRREIYGGGEVIALVAYDDFRPISYSGPNGEKEIYFPFRIHVERPGRGISAEIAYRDVRLNKNIPPSALSIDIPQGITIHPLRDLLGNGD
ncbi:MAG: hypothetical protein ACUVXI_10625 [bacterium]